MDLKKTSIVTVMAFLVMATLGFAQPDQACGDYHSTTLYAGQTIDSGTVTVWNDEENLYVQYTTTDGWELTETHLAVATSLAGIPQTKTGNPKPGKFPYSATHNPAVTEYTYTIPLANLGYEAGDEIVVAAHAVVEKTTLLEEAPYYATAVISSAQGMRKDGSPVTAARSVPEQGLALETGRDETNFFSLGFGGESVVEFACDIANGEGNDVKVWEDTWGTYPLETAGVYASQDGTTWVYLGEADNTNNVDIHTISEFDLGTMAWAKYIKVVDTSDLAAHGSTADGYDLNGIAALQDCTETQEETGWADEGAHNFPGKNWAMYFDYTLQEFPSCVEEVVWQIGDEETNYATNNSADEFNWPGKFGVFPTFADPFYVGTTATNMFPWNSNYAPANYSTDFDVIFDADAGDYLLTVSWSPGKSALEQKEVLLDDVSLGTTPPVLGVSTAGFWNNMPVRQDYFNITGLSDGTHTLNFKHLMGDGTLWDYVRLERVCE